MDPVYPQDNRQEPSSPAMRRPPLRVNNVARRLGMKERNVRHLAATNKISGFKIDGKSWRFWDEEVERYRTEREVRDAER